MTPFFGGRLALYDVPHAVKNAYFEQDPSRHPYVVLAPASSLHTPAMTLLAQGTLADVRHQVTAHQEPFRVLLAKRAVAGVGGRQRTVPTLDRFTLSRGTTVVLIDATPDDPAPFLRQVLVAAAASDAAEAAAVAAALGCPALVCEVLDVVAADLGPAAWVTWDRGVVTLAP